MVANKIFHALGYWQAENQIAELRPDQLTIGESAVTETPSGKTRRLDLDDLAKLLRRAARQPNGAYRMLASRGIANTRGASATTARGPTIRTTSCPTSIGASCAR